jgi:hypothetical protein
MEVEGMDAPVPRFVAQPQPDKIWRDHTMARADQPFDDPAPQVAPGGVAVEQQDRPTVPVIHEMHAVAGGCENLSFERQLRLEPGRELRGRLEGHLGMIAGMNSEFGIRNSANACAMLGGRRI